MNTDLNYWILTIMDMSTKLGYYFEGLEKRVDNLSVCLTMGTGKLYNEIMELNDKKVLLINMRVLYNSMVNVLKKDERLIVEEYAKNRTLDCIAKSLGVNRSTVMRRLNKAVQKCVAVLCALGYSAKKLKQEYFEYFPVYSAFTRIKSEHTVRQAAARNAVAALKNDSVKKDIPPRSFVAKGDVSKNSVLVAQGSMGHKPDFAMSASEREGIGGRQNDSGVANL